MGQGRPPNRNRPRNAGPHTNQTGQIWLQPARAREIIANNDVRALIEEAEQIGTALTQQNVTTSQIRNFFTEVRSIKNFWPLRPEQAYRATVLLKPKLAYAARRNEEVGKKTRGMYVLEQVLSACIDQIMESTDAEQRQRRFDQFAEFFEAIIAYHKFKGGKEF